MKRLRKSAPRSMLVALTAVSLLLFGTTQPPEVATARTSRTRKLRGNNPPSEILNRQRQTQGDCCWWYVVPTFSPVVAPITASPVTAAPVTVSPVTAAPVTAAPITASPVTPSPITASPVTAAPITASPVTAAPITPSPVTPSPITASPVAPAPITASPVTPAPISTASPFVAPSISSGASTNSTAAYESSETLYSQDGNSTTGEDTDLIFLASCGLSDDLNETASPVSNQIVAFDYEITLAGNDTDEEPSPELLNDLEARLNAYLARSYLDDCSFTNPQFQTLAMSSLPLDTVGSRCTDGTSNCYTIHAALTAQIFYWRRRRDLQTTENFIYDTMLLESFGGSLTEAFASDALLLGNDNNNNTITSLQFVRITNFAEGTPTFGGVDPEDSSGATGVVEEKSPSVDSKAGKAGAATFLAFTLVALVAVAVVTIRKRRRATKRNEQLERTAALDDDRLFTFDDEDASGKEPRVVSPPASQTGIGDDEDLTTEEENDGRLRGDAFVVMDHMTDNGDDDDSTEFMGIEVESAADSFGRRNKNPPIFVRANENAESYDPYNHDKTPDTLDL